MQPFVHQPCELAAQPLDGALALPARYYTEPAVTALERTAVFDRAWQLLAHESQLREPGDHVVADFAGLPVLGVRGGDGVVRVFHNVCRHRAGPIARCDGRGARSLRCRYHGWTYALDGALASAPEMAGTHGFDIDAVALPQLQVRTWQGLVFACAADDPPAFDPLVEGIAARLPPGMDLGALGHHQRASYAIDCNWKVYVDNYLEGYHIPHVHPALNAMLDYRSYVTELAPLHALQWSPLESGPGLYGDGDALYYWLWPNTMLNILPGRLQTNRVLPDGVDRCRVEFDFYYPLDASAAAAARRSADLAFSDEVQLEDLLICAEVQRGLASGSYTAGPLNPRRESAVHHFHELLRAALR